MSNRYSLYPATFVHSGGTLTLVQLGAANAAMNSNFDEITPGGMVDRGAVVLQTAAPSATLSTADLATAFKQPYVYAGRHSPYRRRRQGRPTEGLSGHKFLAYAQNHDQLGNRARGDRMCHLANSARERMAAALVLTSPFIPLLFMGEEWSASSPFQYFVSFLDPALNRAVREGRRREFAAFVPSDSDLPDPGELATFERSKLRWDEARRPPGRPPPRPDRASARPAACAGTGLRTRRLRRCAC